MCSNKNKYKLKWRQRRWWAGVSLVLKIVLITIFILNVIDGLLLPFLQTSHKFPVSHYHCNCLESHTSICEFLMKVISTVLSWWYVSYFSASWSLEPRITSWSKNFYQSINVTLKLVHIRNADFHGWAPRRQLVYSPSNQELSITLHP